MSTTDPTPSPAAELVTFVQHQLPGLEDGEYQLSLRLDVATATGKKISDDTLTSSAKFVVLGDRFAVKTPATTVLSRFPPPGATGEFSAVLPHLLFGDETLPWARTPNSAAKPMPAAGLGSEADVPTWLAVFVFDEDDAAANPGLKLEPAPATVGDLYPPALVPASTLGTNYSYFWQAKPGRNGVPSGLEPNQLLTDQISVIDIPLSLFWQIAPTLADLALTAHTRTVSLVNKPTGQRSLLLGAPPTPPNNGVGESLGTAAVVFGTRLPQGPAAGQPAAGGRKTYAYLVSLEALQPFLPTAEAGGPPANQNFTPGASLRLAVLDSWHFFTTGDSAGFVNGLLALNGRDPDGTTDATDTNLRLSYPVQNQTVAAALGMGFVPLNETLRDGGQTVSWYRGPCCPYQNTAPPPKLPISSSDQALAFDPTTGMFDTSYAAAWTLGRQLALQDAGFAATLYRWKADQTAAVVNAVEAEFLADAFGHDTASPEGGRPMGLSRALRRHALLALTKKPS